MKMFFFFPLIFLFCLSFAFAADGAYGNETYGNFSYGVSSSSSSSFSDKFTINATTNLTINATQAENSPNAIIEIDTNATVFGAVTLVQYNSQPPSVGSNTFSSSL